jgi:hypothetical protein
MHLSLPAVCTQYCTSSKDSVLYEQPSKVIRLKNQPSDFVKPHMHHHQASHELQAWGLAFRAISMLRLKQG